MPGWCRCLPRHQHAAVVDLNAARKFAQGLWVGFYKPPLPVLARECEGRGGVVLAVLLRLDLSRAIQSLPEHYRTVIVMRDLEELSIDEICAVLALTRESVKARIHRARLMIREYLVRE